MSDSSAVPRETRGDDDGAAARICPDCRAPVFGAAPHVCGEYDDTIWVKADDVRQWLRGLRRNVAHDLGDTVAHVRGSDHPEAVAQEFSRWVQTLDVEPEGEMRHA